MFRSRITSRQDATGVHFLRVLPELRASQIEDYRNARRDGDVVYFSRHYDLGRSAVPGEFQPVTLLGAVRRVLTSDARTLELPEPVWARFAPHTVILAMAWRLNQLRRRRSGRARLYAIENNDPIVALLGRRIPSVLRTALSVALGIFIRTAYERIAYGSTGAKSAYESLPFVSAISNDVFLELPVGTKYAPVRSGTDPRAVFIGSLDRRKGVTTLVEAWPEVEAALASSHLTVVGAGPLDQDVARWASERPSSRSFLGQVEHSDIDRILDGSDIVIVPSERDGRWREQIGLPIVEGLARGLTVVTTDETGLASWLSDAGHIVIPSPSAPSKLASGIVAALSRPLSRREVIASLPPEEGRMRAARWLLEM
jgi:glycosyltransferase involved in cell wall biosynthesis